jgi:hypothetical protein
MKKKKTKKDFSVLKKFTTQELEKIVKRREYQRRYRIDCQHKESVKRYGDEGD